MVDRSHDKDDRWWRIAFTVRLRKDEETNFLGRIKGLIAEEFDEDIQSIEMSTTWEPR